MSTVRNTSTPRARIDWHLRAAGAAVVAALLLGGCGLTDRGVYDTPLPGGADVGSEPVTLTAEFEDVLDLVPQSSVRADNVPVGRVAKIDLAPDGRSAVVELLVNGDTDLPEGTTARVEQTSLLGEKYVALVRPDDSPAGNRQLESGARLDLDETDRAAQVEQVLGALSMVLNGGDIAEFQTISRELQAISDGEPEKIRTFLTQLEGFVTTVDARSTDIAATLDSLAALSTTLDGDSDKIVSALDGLAPGLTVMEEQRPQFVAMLEALDGLSSVAVETLDAAQADIIADLQLLEPILTQLAASGQDLPNALQILLTYPFPDSVLQTIKGDYLNVFVTTNFRTLPTDCTAIGCEWAQPVQPCPICTGGGGAPAPAPVPMLIPPTSSPLPGVATPTMPTPSPTTPGPTPTDPGPSTPPATTPPPSTTPPSSPDPDDEEDSP
ncbi:MCE family protein [Aeromicrobium sp. Leaf350]|uniref:MCE family protein n=1 Tax=Aeromicrobium sp. Leaf350 TaxID=2876565 RepID=UPI001E3721A2|nr:MCE family protein [Aeromicrobium sp. Leaf350]